MTLKVGQVLKNKDGSEAMVTGVNSRGKISIGIGGYDTKEWWESNGWIIPKEEKWCPTFGEKYYSIDISFSEIVVAKCEWDNDSFDINRYRNNLICKTKSEAEAKALKIKELLNS